MSATTVVQVILTTWLRLQNTFSGRLPRLVAPDWWQLCADMEGTSWRGMGCRSRTLPRGSHVLRNPRLNVRGRRQVVEVVPI